MHKSKLDPIFKLVCKGDVFTTPEGPQTCLIDLPKGCLSFYYRIGVSGLPMDIKREIQQGFIGQRPMHSFHTILQYIISTFKYNLFKQYAFFIFFIKKRLSVLGIMKGGELFS